MRLPRTLRLAFSLPALLGLLPIVIAVVGSGYITYRYDMLLTETRRLVDHSLEVSAAIDGLMISLEDAETGQRGYVITGEEDYLGPYRTAKEELPGDFAALRSLIGDNSGQVASLQRVESLSQSKLAELGTTIDVRRRDGFDAARAIVLDNKGRETMDGIRAEIAAMRGREAALLAARADSMRKTENRVVAVIVICILLGVTGRALSLVVPVLWRRSRARARRAASGRARRG